MKKNNCIFLAGLVVLLLAANGTSSLAQVGREHLSRAIPHSPQAASLANAVEFPMNTFTGTPDVTIPFYTISEGPIKVPITLSYSYNGLKVEEEPSWVGLGWNLNAGGAIIRVIKGQDDRTNPYADLRGFLLPSRGANVYADNLKNENKYQCDYDNTNGGYDDYGNEFFMNRG